MGIENFDDRVLISEYLKGDEKAFEVLLLRHKDKIHRFIYMKVRDIALTEDIFQDAFIKIVKTLKGGSYNEEGKFLPWAMRIAHNLIITSQKAIEEKVEQIANEKVFDLKNRLYFDHAL